MARRPSSWQDHIRNDPHYGNSVFHPAGRILIFAKAPVAGACKTRLAAAIGDGRAADVYRRLLANSVATAVDSRLAPVSLYCAPDSSHPFFHALRRRWRIRLHRQAGGDLGRRMHRAFVTALRDADYAVIIGADSPVLTAEHLDDALAVLHDGEDAVFAPTRDGGYALVGLRRPHYRLFQGVAWSRPTVMRQTRRRLARLGLDWSRLPTLWDIDERADYLQARRQRLI